MEVKELDPKKIYLDKEGVLLFDEQVEGVINVLKGKDGSQPINYETTTNHGFNEASDAIEYNNKHNKAQNELNTLTEVKRHFEDIKKHNIPGLIDLHDTFTIEFTSGRTGSTTANLVARYEIKLGEKDINDPSTPLININTPLGRAVWGARDKQAISYNLNGREYVGTVSFTPKEKVDSAKTIGAK